MKRRIICLMIACLSLFVYPGQLSAGTLAGTETEVAAPVLPPAIEKKINAFKKKHPEMFSNQENKSTEASSAESGKSRGIILFLSGTAIIVGLVLIILFLI